MKKGNSILAVIAARSGSKRCPHKNIRKIGNRTLIERAVDCAVDSELITDIAVTTDYERNKVPDDALYIERPQELTTDEAGTIPTVQHAVGVYEEAKGDMDYVVLLQPTSPFRQPQAIDNHIYQLMKSDKNCLIHVNYRTGKPTGFSYVWKRDTLMSDRPWKSPGFSVHPQGVIETLDIDTELDYEYAVENE